MKRTKRVKACLAILCTGPMLFALGSCNTQDLKTQAARGLATTINGMWGIGVTQFANALFDVDD